MQLISELPSPYRELAEKRREQCPDKTKMSLETDRLIAAFSWGETLEGHEWWSKVNMGMLPLIPTGQTEIGEYNTTNPDHYKQSKETFEEMIDIWGVEAFIKHCEMCAFKYMRRLGKKPTASVQEDIDKANWYLNKANELKSK